MFSLSLNHMFFLDIGTGVLLFSVNCPYFLQGSILAPHGSKGGNASSTPLPVQAQSVLQATSDSSYFLSLLPE